MQIHSFVHVRTYVGTIPRLLNRVQGRVLLMYDGSSTHTAKGLKAILDSLRVPVDAFKYRPDKTISLTEINVCYT